MNINVYNEIKYKKNISVLNFIYKMRHCCVALSLAREYGKERRKGREKQQIEFYLLILLSPETYKNYYNIWALARSRCSLVLLLKRGHTLV
jgi:hypothetical protein